MPNPKKFAKKYKFELDQPVDPKNRRHLGTCVCGTRGSTAYYSFVKGAFCRNTSCKYFQKAKHLDSDEMTMIVIEKKCRLLSLTGTGVNTEIEFICSCGFQQTSPWHLYVFNEKRLLSHRIFVEASEIDF